MDMDHMSGHGLTFTLSSTTPLWSSSWTPSSTGSYAGTCLFLILLSFSLRGFFALKHTLESRWRATDRQRRYVVVAGTPNVADGVRQEGEKMRLLGPRGVEEEVRVVKNTNEGVGVWRLGRELQRAGLGVVIAGVGYLLMLAVMTYNVGYFLSVLGGVFLGELAVGRYAVGEHGEH